MQKKLLNDPTEPKSESDEIQSDYEVLDFNKPDYKFIPAGYHDYVQRGYYLICKSCDLEHAMWIGPEKIMVGKDDKGQPILRKRRDLGIA